MTQSMRPSSPSDTSRGTKSKHFLSRFLANSTHVYTYDGAAPSTDPAYNLQTEHNVRLLGTATKLRRQDSTHSSSLQLCSCRRPRRRRESDDVCCSGLLPRYVSCAVHRRRSILILLLAFLGRKSWLRELEHRLLTCTPTSFNTNCHH